MMKKMQSKRLEKKELLGMFIKLLRHEMGFMMQSLYILSDDRDNEHPSIDLLVSNHTLGQVYRLAHSISRLSCVMLSDVSVPASVPGTWKPFINSGDCFRVQIY